VRIRWRIATFALIVVAIGLTGVWWKFGCPLPSFAYSLAPKLDLTDPPGILTNWQLEAVTRDSQLCEKLVLRSPLVSAKSVPPKPVQSGCGWTNAISLQRVGDIEVNASPIDCGAAAALILWLEHSVQPLAKDKLSSWVQKITHVGTYSCRNIAGTSRRSVHAQAAAIDITGFRLANGASVSLKRDWHDDDAKAAFLRNIHETSCQSFKVSLSPKFNAAHADHFHLDRGRFRRCK
jgi:hypothetical protein